MATTNPRKFTSQMRIDAQTAPNYCPCTRPMTRISCHACGVVFGGRIKEYCDKHANVTYICDWSTCPICKADGYMLKQL